MKKRIFSLIMAVLIVLLLIPAAEAQTGGSALTEWEYTLDGETGTVTLTKYIGAADAVTVPASFEAQGQPYDTVLNSQTVFRANTALKSVVIEAGVGFVKDSMRLLFGECSALTDVDLSSLDTTGIVRMDYMFYNCTALQSVALSSINTEAVTTIRGFFSGCTSLTAADFSAFVTSEVTDMSYLFYNCGALQAVDLSAFDTGSVKAIRAMFSGCTRLSGLTGYENWNTSSLENMSFAFNQFVQSVSASVRVTIDLSRWDLSHLNNSGWCFQNCRAQQILLPDNLAMMSAGFLNHATRYEGTSFTVPAGVKKIGYAHTLYDFATNDLTEIRVAEGNTDYMAVDGVLYSADGKEMLAVPRNKPFENGVFEILEGVDFLGELSFSRNYNIHTVVLPDTYEIEYVPVYADRYIVFEDTGNLNAGTNLSIAIYCYTGITDYAVKETNPRYASVDGIIYSKDMTHVVAVPARYNKAMNIPEGVTSWDREAMWADGSATVDNLLANCPGVTIPSTLTEMADDQFAMLNRLYANRKGTANPFTITVAEGNTVFYLAEDGSLRRPITVTFRNADGTVLQSGTVTYGETPVFSGEMPTRPEDYAYTYSFTGWMPAIGAVTADTIYTATYDAHAKPQDWQSVTIDDQIRINFLLDLDARTGVQRVVIEYVDQDLNDVEKTIVYDDIQTLDQVDGKYRCPAVLAPAQVGDTVKVTIIGDKTDTFTSSVADYCKYLLDGNFSDEVKALAAATLEYGEAAKEFFGYRAETEGFYGTDAAQEAIETVKAIDDTLSVEADGKIVRASFMALTKPEFRFYVDPDCGLTEADFLSLNDRITVTGSDAVSAKFVRNVETGGILLEVTGIEAADMNKVITVDVDGFGTITFRGNDFARLLANNASAAVLGAALYNYGAAAAACFA